MSAAMLTEIAKAATRPVYLFELFLDTATVRNTDAYRDLVHDGNTYVANGHYVGFSPIEESADIQIARVRCSLSNVDLSMVATVLVHTYVDRTLRIYKGFLDDAQALIASPLLIFDGRVDNAIVNDDPIAGASIVMLEASSAWVDFDRRPGRHTSDAEQQIHFPGDRGFEHVSEIRRDFRWGR